MTALDPRKPLVGEKVPVTLWCKNCTRHAHIDYVIVTDDPSPDGDGTRQVSCRRDGPSTVMMRLFTEAHRGPFTTTLGGCSHD